MNTNKNSVCKLKQLLLIIVLVFSNITINATIIPIHTKDFSLLLQTDNENRLILSYFGDRLANNDELKYVSNMFDFTDENIGICNSAYTPSGTWNLSEPALKVIHSDGNNSLELKYDSHTINPLTNGAKQYTIVLKDPVYPVEVKLFYKVFEAENLIEQWTEISHNEDGILRMQKYASANLYFTDKDPYLKSFHNQWAMEMQANSQRLTRGIKTLDSKMGSRNVMLQSQSFIVSFGHEAKENTGKVMLAQLAWSGNFKIDFEVDSYDNLRLIAGINPHASEYYLKPKEVFETPALIYALSNNGTGEASRNMHNWAREHRVLDGQGERLTLLNNWEATYFDFNEKKITKLFKDAQEIGVDLFLLDDGWFGNKYPRNNDDAGLGDWTENKKKLPHGIGYLIKEAHKKDIKFGIWIEPEMVNPESELYENHPDWVIKQSQRPEIYQRDQLVLDLTNPEVQDFVYGVVDRLFTDNPELAFIKWDCNSIIHNAHSAYLAKENTPQSHLYIDYTKGLYKVLERLRAKYPKVPMMLCAGGGGRADYNFLQYFTEFWVSDNTDPLERVFQQWNYSYFYPSIVTDNHVTNWGNQSLKYKVDVASMGKLGFDIVASELSKDELTFCTEAVKNYGSFKEIIWHGHQYRLQNPYDYDVASLLYTSKEKDRVIMFSYLVNTRVLYHTKTEPIKLNGLDANKQYRVNEINLFPNTLSQIKNEQTYSGDFLMKVGLNIPVDEDNPSVVLELTEVK
ncbi:alpha-galactosidase [Saccharicrinis aurantiacus]|uniref:alpha-galactosidase n=1 Tax=Saccharicrinis aurantiacus TaxID=1849719 RepID=UPI002492E19A|nr:alpha-galactosidase [Saccharicrinis aurantiacus]